MQGLIFMASQLMVRQEMDSFHAYLLRLEPVLEGPDVPVPVGIDAVDHDEPQIEAGAASLRRFMFSSICLLPWPIYCRWRSASKSFIS